MRQFSIVILFTAIVITSCHNNKEAPSTPATGEVVVNALPGQCPYLTKDAGGTTIVSWVRINHDSSSAFCYAASKDGKTFTAPIIIPASNKIQPHGENLPKIIFKPGGEIIALWGERSTNKKNKYAGMVFYVQSFDAGKSWTSPRPLTPDTASYDQRYYDVALLPNGEAAIIWLDNRKTGTKEGSALYFASTKGKDGFVGEKRIAESCCQCCRTDLFVDSKGSIHTLYRGILQDSIRDMVHAVSTDGGASFSSPKKISDDRWVVKGCPHTGPAMTESKEGLQFAWFTGGKNKGCYYASSTDNGQNFSPRNGVSAGGSHPQLASTPNNNILIVWDETVQVANKVYKKIGVQKRAGDGKEEGKEFITSDTATASFPVITMLNNEAPLVAYSKKIGGKEYVVCQLLTLK